MHVVCSYPVKCTWIKVVKAWNSIGCHSSQRRMSKSITPRQTKPTRATSTKHAKMCTQPNQNQSLLKHPIVCPSMVRKIKTSSYDTCGPIFSDQTGQFPTRSQQGSKYIIVMVEINNNAIIVEPMKSRASSLQQTCQPAQTSRHNSQEACAWQQIVREHEESHPRPPQVQNGIVSTRMSQMQCNRWRNSKLQISLSQCPCRHSN